MIDTSKYTAQPKDLYWIKDVFKTTFQAIEDLDEAQRVFSQEFNTNAEKNVFKGVTRAGLLPLTSNVLFLDQFKDPEYLAGVDLPMFIEKKGGANEGTIMIVAEDPLRSEKRPEVVLSTPFGVQSKEYRRKSGKLYWQFFEELLERHPLYLTDINKLYLRHHSARVKLPLPEDLKNRFRKGLNAEIEKVKPGLIISFGKPAREALGDVDRPVLNFIHPSFSAYRHWKTKHNIGWPVRQGIVNYMLKETRAMVERISV